MPYLGNEVAPLVQALEGKELKLDSDGDSSITADTDDQIDFKIAGADFAKMSDQTLTLTSSTSSRPGILLLDTNADANPPFLRFQKDSASPADNDEVAAIQFYADDDGGNVFIPSQIKVVADDVSNGSENGSIRFETAVDGTTAERMRIDSNGNILVHKTSANHTDVGHVLFPQGGISIVRDGSQCAVLNRLSSDGTIIDFRKDGSTVGSIGTDGGYLYIGSSSIQETYIGFNNNYVYPSDDDGAFKDNAIDLGNASARFDDIYAGNTSIIGTSDKNEKQDIASVTAKELSVATKLSALFKTFRWKDKVTEKGDKARTHTGIIAQEVQSAFSAEGLDASKYGLFCSNTWWEKEIKVDAVEADEEKGIEAKDAYTYIDTKKEKTEGYTERTRLGVRYAELFSFIFSSIEARLTALENK